ncbi:MAG: glycoside hydrolase family 1 protein [Anaerolineales bacterium]
MAQATHSFPDSFLFGAATSGYQVEGNSTQTDFWQWEQQLGRIAQGHKSGNACEWWEAGRWREDFDRAANDGHNAHRLSVEWSRVEPSAGRWDEAALDHYRDMVRGLRERGLMPLVTLHHFVNPLWLAERNAWETGEAISLFARFVDKVVRVLGEYIDFWATINEPNIYMYFGWINGVFPPGKKNFFLATRVAGNLLRAHAAAYRTIHAIQPHARVGLPIHFRPIAPAHPNFAPDVWVARTQFNLFSSLFSDAIRSGRLRQLLRPAISIPEAKGTQDYIGLNYYSADVARFDVTNPMELFGRRSFPDGAENDGSGLYASHPPGLFESLKWAHRLKLPIYITENGIGGEEDGLRRRYLISHLRQAWRAVNFSWDVRGYFHWSLLDNFEWERGWTHRFGLYALDTSTQIRTPRPSARLYAEICQSRTLSSEMVARFAPELLETLFPG